jgi:hypothetical protein
VAAKLTASISVWFAAFRSTPCRPDKGYERRNSECLVHIQSSNDCQKQNQRMVRSVQIDAVQTCEVRNKEKEKRNTRVKSECLVAPSACSMSPVATPYSRAAVRRK